MIDQGDDRAVNVFEFERLRLVSINVGDIDAEIAGNAGVGEQRAGVLNEWRELASLRCCRGADGEQNAGRTRARARRLRASDATRFTDGPQKVLHIDFSIMF